MTEMLSQEKIGGELHSLCKMQEMARQCVDTFATRHHNKNMKVKKMTGSEWGAVGVFITFVGALFAWYGTRLSGQEAKARGEAQLALTQELAAKSEEIADLNRELSAAHKQYAAYITGAESFFYLHTEGFGGASPQVRIVHIGINPVRDTEILVYDVSSQVPAITSGEVKRYDIDRAPQKRSLVDIAYPKRPSKLAEDVLAVNPDAESYTYFVNLSGGNGTFRQLIQFVKVGPEWKQAYKIDEVLEDDTLRPIGAFFDTGFPRGEKNMLSANEKYKNLNAPH
jgi:hypothetical protein